jgi:hypothetical protein
MGGSKLVLRGSEVARPLLRAQHESKDMYCERPDEAPSPVAYMICKLEVTRAVREVTRAVSPPRPIHEG